MPHIDETAGEVHVKIVYYGPGLSGRRTNLQYIYGKTRPEARGRFESVATETAYNLGGHLVTVHTIVAFEVIPLSIAPIRGCRLRLRLFTTPSALYVEGVGERALEGADGVVFIADSQRVRHDANVAAMEALTAAVTRQGRTLAAMPLVLQYNKRDLPDILPVTELDAALNPDGRPYFGAVAPTGQGVFDTLKTVVTPIVGDLRAPGRSPVA